MKEELGSQLQVVESAYHLVINFLVSYSFQIIGALLVFVIGLFVARWVRRVTERFCLKYRLDPILVRFASASVYVAIMAGVLVICLGKLGISVAPFVAAIGAVSLGAGLALQGTVSNYAAGLVLILTRPFRVGDTLTVLGEAGLVSEVGLGTTVLDTEDGEKITIPNKKILGEVLRNSFANKVWEGEVGIALDADAQRAVDLVREVLVADADVTREPAAQVGIQRFGESAVWIGYRYWVPTCAYYTTGYRVNQAIWDAFRQAGIRLAAPQREVRLIGEAAKP